jgi:predicted transcriptional regulator
MNVFEVTVKEVPLSGIKSPEQLAAFVLQSLGLSDLDNEKDVDMLLALVRNKGGLKASELQEVAGLGQTATYARVNKFLDAGLIYKAKGAVYRLRERTLKDTLDFRVRRDIEQVFNSIVEVGGELDTKIK